MSYHPVLRLFGLYLRARRAWVATAIFPAIAALGWAWAERHGDEPRNLMVVLVLCPLVVACVVGIGTYSPLGEVEQTASWPLPILRLGHLGGLLVVGAALLVLVALPWPRDDAGLVLARNLAGFAGLAFLGARGLGSHLSWVVPVAFGLVAFFGPGGTAVDGGWLETRWAWPKQPGEAPLAAVVALTLLGMGLGIVSRSGASHAPGDIA